MDGMSISGITGGTALAISLGALYYAHNQSKKTQSDLTRIVQQTRVLNKGVDGIKVNNERIIALSKLIEQQQKIIKEQNIRFAYLFTAMIDMQKFLYQNGYYQPIKIPEEYIISLKQIGHQLPKWPSDQILPPNINTNNSYKNDNTRLNHTHSSINNKYTNTDNAHSGDYQISTDNQLQNSSNQGEFKNEDVMSKMRNL